MAFSQAIQSKVHKEPLGDFPLAAFLKFLLRDPVVERRYYVGELPHDLLTNLYVQLGGTPRLLGQMIEVLKTIPADDLRRELAAVELPAEVEASVLRDVRDRYCEQIFTARLYARLNPESRRALSCAAVYGVPVNLAGLAAVAGELAERMRKLAHDWQAYAFAYSERERATGELWAVYGLLRGWLLAPERLSPDERRVAHGAAGDFLRELVRQGGESGLGLSWVDCMLEARAQYLAAGVFERARAVTNPISNFLALRGLSAELAQINLDLLTYEEHPRPMGWIGQAYFRQGSYGTAREWYQRSLAAAGSGTSADAAVAWHGLATIDVETGEYVPAREKYQKALEIREEIGDQAGEARTWHSLGVIDAKLGSYEPAREKFQKALEILQKIGDLESEAGTWHSLGTIDLEQGKYEPAREKFQKALPLAQQIGDRSREAVLWHGLARIDLRVGHYQPAREKFQKALAIAQQIGDRSREAGMWHGLATIDLRVGHYQPAREKFQKALEVREEIGDQSGEAASWHQLATIDMSLGEYGPAREKFQKSLEIEQRIGDRRGEAGTFSQLGSLAAKLGRLADGVRLVALCFLIDRSIGHGDTESDFDALAKMASQLSYTKEQLEALLREVAEAYQVDRGWELVGRAFTGLV